MQLRSILDVILISFHAVLSQAETHIVDKLWNRKIKFKLAVFKKWVYQCEYKWSYKTAFIVCDNLLKVVFHKRWSEVCQVEATVILDAGLVYKIQNNLIRVFLVKKWVG